MTTLIISVTSSATNAGGGTFGQQPDQLAPSFYDMHVTGSTNALIPNGVYDAYCIDPTLGINLDPRIFNADSYESSGPASFQQIRPTDANFGALTQLQVDKLNWLLSQNFTADSKFAGKYNYGEVQTAIWRILGFSQATIDSEGFGRYLSDNNRNLVVTGDIDFLLSAAQAAVTTGHYVSPPPGTNFSMLIDPSPRTGLETSPGLQPLIVQLKNAKLGDFVWLDNNVNGIQDNGESGVDNLVVELWKDGVKIASTTTGDDFSTLAIEHGFYQFAGLGAGDYQVKFVAPDYQFTVQDANGNLQDAQDSDANPGNGFSQVVHLAAGGNNQTVDAGVYKAASLGDRVWTDTNANGVQDNGELGKSGVTVELYTCVNNVAGVLVTSQLTDGNGNYSFTGLVPGDYIVKFIAADGSVLSTANVGNDALDSDAGVGGFTGCYTLASGENNTTVDAGYYQTASLGDRVWVDNNANGQQDAGEAGIVGQLVTLIGGGADGLINGIGDTTTTTTTGANGIYQFTGLTPGQEYQVQFSKPAGSVFTGANIGNDVSDSDADTTTGKTQIVTLASGENNTTLDAGVYQTASLGDRVWVDSNANGQQDNGEANVAGVRVFLLNQFGTTIDTQLTDASGNYHFVNLVPGTYSVKFDLTTLPAGYSVTTRDAGLATDDTDSDADPLTGATIQTVLTSGEDDRSWDLGIKGNLGIDIEKLVHGEYLVQGATGGEGLTPGFWKNHSVYGPAPLSGWPETGLSPNASYETIFGVDVPGSAPSLLAALGTGGGGVDALLRHSTAALLNASDPYISYAYTKAQIISMVQSAFANGTYEPTKNLFATQNELGADLTTLANSGSTLVVTPDVDADTSGSGPVIPVGGTAVFTYIVKNTGTVELSNIQLTDDRIASLTFVGGDTDHDGRLDVTETWTYTARETVLQSGTEYVNIGTVVGRDNVSGVQVTDNDAAHYNTPSLTQSLGDRVWLDSNANGIQDAGEVGLAGVTVQLKSTGGAILQTATTNAEGNYLFDVAAGSYKVTFLTPNGYVVSAKDSGGNDNTDSDIDVITKTTDVVTVAAGQQNLSVDAGLYQTASLGDRVWLDTNANGQQDVAETGVNGVTVTLIGGGADGLINNIGDTTQTTLTAGDGNYLFSNLTPGTQYQVMFGKPGGYNFTTANVGNDASDSDAIAATGKSQIVTLASGESNLTLDAGLVAQTATIGNRVWLDCNANGIQDNGEMGVANVTVKLLSAAGTVLATQTTDVNGEYQFTGLNPGDYAVQFTPLTGYNFTTKDANNNNSDALDSDADIVTGKTITTTLSAGEIDLTWDAGLTPVCRPVTFDFSGSSATDGTDGNSRSYTDGLTGVSVTARAFSQDKGTNTWQNAFLGAYGGGLGVTDSSEGTGGNNTHTVDNVGRNNYIVLQFSQAVLVDKAYLGYVVGDSDAQIWVGNSASAITTMNNSVLTSASYTEVNTTTLTTARWADFNATGVRGNVFIIAADTTDTTPEDYFKLQQVAICAPDYCAPVAKASIGNYVWEDKNFNGVQDANEAGISNVTVKLLSSTGVVLATTTTDVSGAYAFTNLNPGDYKVQVVTPSGYFITKKDIGGNTLASDAQDSDLDATGTTALTTLTVGENDMTWDGGLYRKASVGDKVWEDKNHNWLQDATEPGIGGVKVALMDATGTTVLQTTTTNAAGNYLFADLDPGTYVLRFDKGGVLYNNIYMDNWKWGVKDVGSNDAIDSDVAGNGIALTNVTKTDAFTLMSGQADMTRDAAITPIVIDLDGNGIQTISRANSGGTFDLFGNGAGIHSGWVSAGDGFLAVDKNGNGAIDNIGEMFGGNAKGAGFANLAAYDSNHDGVVDKRDANFADLLIWRDANGNHATDAGELNGLAHSGIASLAVGYTEVPFLDAQGNLHLERSTATLDDGSSVAMTDVYFNVSVDDAAAAGVTLPTIGELLGNNSSMDGLLAGLGVAPAASAEVASDSAFDTGAADAMKQMAQLYDQVALAA